MNRLKTRTSQFIIDIGVLAFAFLLATLLRFDWEVPRSMFRQMVIVLPYVVLLQYTLLTAFGITRFSWRYISLRDAVRIFGAIASAGALLVALRFLAPLALPYLPLARYGIVPLGILLGDFVLAFVGITGVRALRRLVGEHEASRQHERERTARVRTILVGAGQGGVHVAQEIARRPDLGIDPVAFVDDDPVKVGSVIQGVKVCGTTNDLPSICRQLEPTQAVITISSAPGTVIRRITDECKKNGLTVKIVPGTYQIVGGRVNLSRIRDVAIEDLLRREPVRLNATSVNELVRGSCVMVTGAGGSIGSELCRQLAAYRPSNLVLVERAENNLFEIHKELRERFDGLQVSPCLADITDMARIERVFVEHVPMIVFHAAAHKHVPMMEWNPGEAIKNNILGTRIVADLAHRTGVERFVMVSTDKAVNPSSVMGASKRAAELYVQALSRQSPTRFATVRFGNVLGSAGSVIPIFRKQIREGGPITVTHSEMTRYFMTIPEAVQLVTQATTLSDGGETFILDMGEPVRIVDLANDLIRLSGLEPEKDIEVVFTGVRPGEKLFEELATKGEGIERTSHPKIFVGRYDQPDVRELRGELRLLEEVCNAASESQIRGSLSRLVPEYGTGQNQSDPPPKRSSQAPAPAKPASAL